jgi:hypothetical protein
MREQVNRPARNLSRGKALDAVQLVRSSRARTTSWPEAKASPTGRIHAAYHFSSSKLFACNRTADHTLLWGRSPHLAEARKRISARRAYVRRAGVHVARHAERRQKGNPEVEILAQSHPHAMRLCRGKSANREVTRSSKPEGKTREQGTGRSSGLPNLLPWSCPPDVRSTLRRTGIAGEVVVLQGTSNPVLSHAICVRGYARGNICSGRPDGTLRLSISRYRRSSVHRRR